MKRLVDGEFREIRASREFSMCKHKHFKVHAERYDCDSPYVHLTISNGFTNGPVMTLAMTDSETLDLIDRLQRALSVLPSSK